MSDTPILPQRKRNPDGTYAKVSAVDRFWAKVNKTDSCWLWTGSTSRGYGQFRVGNKVVPAHRWAYQQAKGPIPKGLELDHLCRVRHCVNPDHLEAVTNSVNWLRGQHPSAVSHRSSHCHRGHPFTEANTYILKNKYRRCRTCDRERHRRYREQRKLAAKTQAP